MLTQSQLEQFTGTEQYYFNPMYRWLRYTDGVRFMAQEGGAYWLLDAIASYKRQEPFQVWRLDVRSDGRIREATLTMREDSGQPELVRQEIEYTDFPLMQIELWLIDGVLILPSEY